MWVQSLGQEDPLEKGMATQSSILALEIPWGHKELDMTVGLPFHFSLSSLEKAMATYSTVLAWSGLP